MALPRSDWDTGSGLLDDFILEVDEAWFGPDEENDDDRTFLFLRGVATDNEDGEVVDEEYRERWGAGKGWEPADEGREAEHASGKNKFVGNSGVGRLVRSMVDIDDETAELLGERGSPFQAVVYENLRIRFERKVFKFHNRQTDEDVEYTVPLAVEVSERKKKAGGKKAAGKKSASKKSAGKKAGGKKSSAKKEPTEKDTRRKLVKLAGKFDEDDHDDFVEKALEDYPELEGFDDLHADMLDEDGDLWTEAHEDE